jgi:mono/diheme cytochrome c family protein
MSTLQNRIFTYLALGLLMPFTASAQSGDKKEKNKDLLDSVNWRKWAPHPAPFLTPEETAKGFKVAPGFRVELVAASPMIKDPVFAEFDLKGRLWVCEFQSYMMNADGTGEHDAISRVQVLQDTDGDGRMDKATTFLDKIVNPRSLSIVKGGALVSLGNGKLIFAEDTDGDLVADKRTSLIDFATAAPNNIEHAENGLHYAIDNWMYNSKSQRRLQWRDGQLIETPTKSRGQWGMAADAYGRLYYNANSVWFQSDSEIYDQQYGKAGPPTNAVYAIRTNTAINRAYQPGTIQEDGRINRITSVSGLAVHSDGAYGEDWQGTIFSFSPGTNTVGAFVPKAPMPASSKYQHMLYPDENWSQREFLASTDERFRPVNGSIGPDGCLYIVDLNRGIIQDKVFLTSYLRRQSEERELDKHIGKGRIWRVVPENHKSVAAPKGLVEGLSHPHLWWRIHSQKRIVEEQQADLVPDLIKLATNGNAKARPHAMWALAGLDSLTKKVIISNLSSSDWFVSLTALRLAGEAYGDSAAFPAELVQSAEKLSKSNTALVAKYAQTLISKGYPKRNSSVYKDKVPQWVKQNAALDKAYASGMKTYGQFCSACHQPHGKGMANIAPSLVKSDWVNGDSKILMGVAVHGLSGPIHINGKAAKNIPPIMPGHGFLTDQQLADALTYVRNAWGNKSDQISPNQIKSYREKNADRVAPWTEDELRSEQKTSAAASNDETTDLFASGDFSAWTTAKGAPVEKGWKIEDGVIHRHAKGGDIITKASYKNFELSFEWKISKAGNSGVKYRTKGSLGLEYQVLDDQNHPDRKIDNHLAASMYEIIAAPANKPIKPVGEWNKARIVAKGNHIEHWLNGVKVIEIEYGSDDWKARFKKSKYSKRQYKKKNEGFGSWEGPILLQDHQDPAWFRNLKIKKLD